MTRTKEQLIAENKELSSSLAETKEILQAIQNGEVDAIIVSGKEGDQVYSLSSAVTPYRTFIEEMGEGAVTITKNGIILYCNRTFAEFMNRPIEKVIGSDLNSFIAPLEKSKIKKLLGKQTRKREVVVLSSHNSLHLRLSLSPLPTHMQGDVYVLIVTDISELKQRENELHDIISALLTHIKALRALRIENINYSLDIQGRKNKLEIANNKLYKEITNLNRIVASMKQKLKKTAT